MHAQQTVRSLHTRKFQTGAYYWRAQFTESNTPKTTKLTRRPAARSDNRCTPKERHVFLSRWSSVRPNKAKVLACTEECENDIFHSPVEAAVQAVKFTAGSTVIHEEPGEESRNTEHQGRHESGRERRYESMVWCVEHGYRTLLLLIADSLV